MREPIQWPPQRVPAKFPLTAYKDGWCKTINGKWRHVCGKLPAAQAKARYMERIRNGDFGARRVAVATGSGMTVKGLANLYGGWLLQRIQPGHRRKIEPRTLADYMKAIQLFLDTPLKSLRLADVRVEELIPQDFAAFLDRIPGSSPYSRSRYVATIKAMFNWAGKEGHLQRLPVFGADFSKATKDELREARAGLTKAFDHDELRTIIQASMFTRVWYPLTLLALNGAFSNIEIARLRRDQIDLDLGLVQSVRGKKGRAFRKTMLWPVTVQALRAYQRPAASHERFEPLFFLTRNGIPYSRTEVTTAAEGATAPPPQRKDVLTGDFGKFIGNAGLPREGRSFSGLRTTFRTEAEGMVPIDHDAIDLVMGHPRRHISSEYVERFPEHRLQSVTDHVFAALFNGWSMDIEARPTRKVQRWSAPTAPPANAA